MEGSCVLSSPDGTYGFREPTNHPLFSAAQETHPHMLPIPFLRKSPVRTVGCPLSPFFLWTNLDNPHHKALWHTNSYSPRLSGISSTWLFPGVPHCYRPFDHRVNGSSVSPVCTPSHSLPVPWPPQRSTGNDSCLFLIVSFPDHNMCHFTRRTITMANLGGGPM